MHEHVGMGRVGASRVQHCRHWSGILVAWISHYLHWQSERRRQLELADQVALRVARRLDVFLLAKDTTAPLFDLFFDSEHAIQARQYMRTHLKRDTASEQDLIALIVAARGISHHLSQAITLLEQSVSNIEMLADTDVPEEKRARVILQYKGMTDAAFVSFVAARKAIRDYLISRRFKDVPLDQVV
ncbi:hypothetical protein [Xanthomonas sacchari]|uniref:hypothetical protein n=1 Tax=Xanthomonas sacchari TaxID=56458 RepID=UPI00225E181A|nr:hypothetical protein [Xanthomonas sacchari]